MYMPDNSSFGLPIQGTGLSGTIGQYLRPAVSDLQLNLSDSVNLVDNPRFIPESNLIHLAGIVGESKVRQDLNLSTRVNITAVSELGEEFLANGTGVFFYVSSSHVYAQSTKLVKEEDPVGPNSIYAEQKLQAETNLQNIFRQDTSRLCIVRVFSVLDWDCPTGTLGGTIRSIAQSAKSETLKTANDTRDFLTPRKIAHTIKTLARSEASGIWNLCSSEALTIKEATQRLLEARGLASDRITFQETNSVRPFLVGDNSKLKTLLPLIPLNWQPTNAHDA
jgi:nucleoside-diphosphate-sugar epimerase